MNDVSERIVSLRKQRGLSQREFAKKIGVSQPSVIKFEKGETGIIPLSIAIKIALELKVSFSELFEIESNNENDNNLKEQLIELQKDNNSLSTENERLKSELEIQNKLINAYETNIENNRSIRKELKYYKQFYNLFQSFELINIDEFMRHNTCSITSEDLITTIKFKAIHSFYDTYVNNSDRELTKYFDIEKYKKSEKLEYLTQFWEGDERWTKEKIIQWLIEEKKKLSENNKSIGF